MIDHEDIVYEAVETALRAKNSTIHIVGVELTDTPPKFPAVSIVQTNNRVVERYSTFDKVDNVASEEYKFDVYSNLESQKSAKLQTKNIITIIDGVMSGLEYIRTFCQPVPSADKKYTRYIARYKKENVTQED